jgi:hypothetical protein
MTRVFSVEQKSSNLKYRTGNTGYPGRFGMAQKRYCQYCGAEISPTTRYCPSCGAAQQAPTQPQQQPYIGPQPQPQPQPYYQPPAQTYQPPPPVATNKSTGNILAAVSIILGIVGLFVAGIILGIVAIIVGVAAISKKSRAGGAVGIILGIIAFVAALLLILGVITV